VYYSRIFALLIWCHTVAITIKNDTHTFSTVDRYIHTVWWNEINKYIMNSHEAETTMKLKLNNGKLLQLQLGGTWVWKWFQEAILNTFLQKYRFSHYLYEHTYTVCTWKKWHNCWVQNVTAVECEEPSTVILQLCIYICAEIYWNHHRNS